MGVESRSVVSPAEAVELCRKAGTEPPAWLLEQAGLAPRAPKVRDEDHEEYGPEDYGWRRYKKGWGDRR